MLLALLSGFDPGTRQAQSQGNTISHSLRNPYQLLSQSFSTFLTFWCQGTPANNCLSATHCVLVLWSLWIMLFTFVAIGKNLPLHIAKIIIGVSGYLLYLRNCSLLKEPLATAWGNQGKKGGGSPPKFSIEIHYLFTNIKNTHKICGV